MQKKTVLITGCSSGFGKLTANTFHDKGWNVIATMRSPERETELIAGDHMLVTKLDVTDVDSIAAAFDTGRAKFGTIDTVVNNAGYGGHGLFEQFSTTDARAMFETNVFGPMNVMRQVLPAMRQAGGGTIVNVTSMAGHLPLPGGTIYSASKYALVGLTEAMALEYRPLGIRFFNVAPGAYPSTHFSASTDRRLDEGDEQLVAFSKRQRAQLDAISQRMASEGGTIADPQEVADKIFACATSDMPINNPAGGDAEMLNTMMRQDKRQEFLDQFAAWTVPTMDGEIV